jgi:hypothetical protein
MSGPIRLLVGSDSAGFDYKDHILADMQADDRVEVVDLGVFKEDLEGSSYPSVAIEAERGSRLARLTARSWCAARESESPLQPTRYPASVPRLPTTRSAWSDPSCPTIAKSSRSANG